jgi:16S rRNA (adenine1518-N6/adenine1519-N6)-dimethyltransferase
MPEEIFDVVDEADRVVGQAPRSLVHAQQLRHRAVHIFVFNTCGDLLIHERSALKDEFPRCYTSSASGHLSTGEDYLEAAVRELAEELGLDAPLTYLAKFPASPQTAHEHTVLYRTTTDETPRPDPGEIASIEFLSLAVIQQRLERHPEKFSPPFVVLFRWYCNQAAQSPTQPPPPISH